MSNIIDDLTNSFSRLPGIGKKSAARIVNNLLKANPAYIQNFARQLSELQQKIKPCSVCGAWTEINPCPICSNPLRDKSLICVVEQPQDVITIDSTGTFSGLFHVLGGVIAPLEGIGPEQLNIASLLNRAKTEAIKEIIIATNPTFEGDSTAMYLQRLLSEFSTIKVTRLATGIPVGGDLEYADKLTLARSFSGRTTL
ncbi:MAG: recombination mediator RecR [Treponema sp.]|jgi:recombination protein RecR|nr:recombination mediator RecR [Treponema sp.]